MRGIPPEVPATPSYNGVRAEEERAERVHDAEIEEDYDEMRDNPAATGKGRWLVYFLVAVALGALLLVVYLLARYLFSL